MILSFAELRTQPYNLSMVENSDDLTPIKDYSKELNLEKTPTESRESVIEKIDEFESLESLTQKTTQTEIEGKAAEPLSEEKTDPFAGLNFGSEHEEQKNVQLEQEVIPSGTKAIEEIKEFAENITEPKSEFIEASNPFSLYIDGILPEIDKARLLELLNKENFGIREIDLEPQFAAGKILIPQMSEYAAVVIYQLLRETRVKFRLVPSHEHSGTEADTHVNTQDPTLTNLSPSQSGELHAHSQASHIPILTTSALLNGEKSTPITSLLATGVITSKSLDTEKSLEFTELLESLKLELQYKAYRKKATHLLDFKFKVEPISHEPSQYRILISATAVKETK